MGPPVQKMRNPQERTDIHGIFGPTSTDARRVTQIVPNAEMGKQATVLKHVSQAPLVHRHICSRASIEQNPAVQRDPSLLRRHQARDGFDDRCFAAARPTEEHGHAFGRLERGVQIEPAKGPPYVDGQTHDPEIRLATRRDNHSDRISAPMAMATATMTRRIALVSPPGT